MFRWLTKKKQQSQESAIPNIVEQELRSLSLVTKLSKVISDYLKDVKSGRMAFPAHKRLMHKQKNSSVLEIWRDTRLEALHHIFRYGSSHAILLDKQNKQKELLDIYFKKKPHLEFPHQPSGDVIHDTFQAVFKAYLYLDETGEWSEEPISIHDVNLFTKKKPIIDEFEREMKRLREQWSEFESAIHDSKSLPSAPSTIFDILYKDITKKSKTVALSSMFGSDYMAGIKKLEQHTRNLFKEQGNSEEQIDERMRDAQKTTQKLLSAQDPDQMV